jgi:hypothetical protein
MVTPVVVTLLLSITNNEGLVVAEKLIDPGATILIWILSAADAPSYTICGAEFPVVPLGKIITSAIILYSYLFF